MEWSIDGGGTPPPTPAPRDDLRVFATARAYGFINGKIVMVRISHNKSEPPSERDLRSLWEAQAAKVRFHDAAENNKQRFAVDRDNADAPMSGSH